jgi:ArsR family transcriptional regulator
MAMNSDDGVEGACAGSGLNAAEALFHSLSDSTRLTIVQRLARGEARVTDLVEQLGLAQSTVSKHVSCLRDCGLVDGRPQGRQVFYSLSHPELMELLAAAETLLAATGNAVALCPTYGTDSAAAAERAGSGTRTGTAARDE